LVKILTPSPLLSTREDKNENVFVQALCFGSELTFYAIPRRKLMGLHGDAVPNEVMDASL